MADAIVDEEEEADVNNNITFPDDADDDKSDFDEIIPWREYH